MRAPWVVPVLRRSLGEHGCDEASLEKVGALDNVLCCIF